MTLEQKLQKIADKISANKQRIARCEAIIKKMNTDVYKISSIGVDHLNQYGDYILDSRLDLMLSNERLAEISNLITIKVKEEIVELQLINDSYTPLAIAIELDKGE